MGFVHDEVVRSGHAVDYLCSEDLRVDGVQRPAFRFQSWHLRKALTQARTQEPYDIINIHEPSGAAIAPRP